MRKHREQEIAVKKAYDFLVEYSEALEIRGNKQKAREVQNVSKMLWLNCMDAVAPWSNGPACDHIGK